MTLPLSASFLPVAALVLRSSTSGVAQLFQLPGAKILQHQKDTGRGDRKKWMEMPLLNNQPIKTSRKEEEGHRK